FSAAVNLHFLNALADKELQIRRIRGILRAPRCLWLRKKLTLRLALAALAALVFTVRLPALAFSLLLAFVATSTRTGSRLVVLGEDHFSSVVTSGYAAGTYLIVLRA